MTESATPRAGRLLIVDDEAHVREGLRLSMQLGGFEVEAAESGPVAVAWLERASFDVMVVDMTMPGMSGVEVMQAARRVRSDIEIVVLTGNATLESAIAAVKAGAADYLLKPVSVHDLKAVVTKALNTRDERLRQERVVRLMNQVVDTLRQPAVPSGLEDQAQASGSEPAAPTPATSLVLRAGMLTLDVEKRTVQVDGRNPFMAGLTEGECAVLRELIQHLGQVRSCRQLVKAAWGYDMLEIEATSMVRSYVYRLRKKIEADPDHPVMLKTVRGGGYYLEVG